MDLQELTEKAKNAIESIDDFKKSVKLDFGDIGMLFMNGETKEVSNSDNEADATIRVKFDDFTRILKRELDPTMAFFQNKIKVEGDVGVLMQLQNVLSERV